MAEQLELYCPICKKYPLEIIERYLTPIEEERVWDGECFELIGSNIDFTEFEQLCGTCGSNLVFGLLVKSTTTGW